MLYNLANCRNSDLTKKLIEYKNSNKNDNSYTQATFVKSIPTEKIQVISPIYNNLSKATQLDFEKYDYKKNHAPYCNDIDNMEELDKRTVIAHFAGYKKPWYNPEIKFANEWWKYAKMINPKWKKEKREFIERSINTFILLKNENKKGNLIEYFKDYIKHYKQN